VNGTPSCSRCNQALERNDRDATFILDADGKHPDVFAGRRARQRMASPSAGKRNQAVAVLCGPFGGNGFAVRVPLCYIMVVEENHDAFAKELSSCCGLSPSDRLDSVFETALLDPREGGRIRRIRVHAFVIEPD